MQHFLTFILDINRERELLDINWSWMEGKWFFRISIILNLNKDADRSISFYHLNRRNRAKILKSHNSDSDVGTRITCMEKLQQGKILQNLGEKKLTAEDMQSRDIWGFFWNLVVLDHTSSSLLLFTNSISQIYLENGKKTEDRKIQLSGAGTD